MSIIVICIHGTFGVLEGVERGVQSISPLSIESLKTECYTTTNGFFNPM